MEVAEADLQEQDSTEALFAGADTVFFPVQSMGGKNEDFEEAEQHTARTVASAAEKEGVRQMVYLSGLHPKDMPIERLSKHMRSREKVALTFLDSAVPTIVLQAATLIGSGSASYEMIRHLTERLPIMIAPKWINNMIEPISIRDTLYYLLATADLEKPVNEAFDIGCGTQYRFSDLLRLHAKERGLRRFISAVPLSLPLDHLSGLWISLVTPAPYGLAVPLAQSMAKDCVTADRRIRDLIPDPEGGLADYPTSVHRALQRETESTVPTSWDDSWKHVDSITDSLPTDPDWAGHTVFTDERERITDVSREKLWQVIEGIGGTHGWYSSPSLWAFRGLIDKLVGGPARSLLPGRQRPRGLVESGIHRAREEAGAARGDESERPGLLACGDALPCGDLPGDGPQYHRRRSSGLGSGRKSSRLAWSASASSTQSSFGVAFSYFSFRSAGSQSVNSIPASLAGPQIMASSTFTPSFSVFPSAARR